jgi:propionyl-CoA carboxylase alpha chain
LAAAFNAKEAEEGFGLARSEAKSSFGDDRIFIEKFIENPRHIEIQVLGDKHGTILYLGERECSIQRRNQKVVEEAPSPLLDARTRKAMGEQAVALARAVGYDSAGTVEFVAAQDRSFFFLEMNTRLQVEHPVTELVTGIDLVEQMIRIAAGEKLKLKQADVKLDGWAVESRIYAEDPTRNFLPSIGRLVRYRPPKEGSTPRGTIRNDTGVFEGAEISTHYDPMIAKLVTHGVTREAAIDLQADALDAFVIDGVEHNIPFLSALMRHPRWREGRLSTGFIAEEYKGGFKPRSPEGAELQLLAAVAIAVDHLANTRRRRITQQMGGPEVRFASRRIAQIGDARVLAQVEGAFAGPIKVTFPDVPGKRREVLEVQSDWWPGQPVWTGMVHGRPVSVQVRPILNGYDLSTRGLRARAHVYTEREAALAALMPEKTPPDTSKLLLCPMPGQVKAIHVAVGQEVKTGEALCVVEAMKMENILRAEREAVVKTIKAKPGDSLAVDAVIMEFA